RTVAFHNHGYPQRFAGNVLRRRLVILVQEVHVANGGMLAFAPVSICCIGGSACHLRIVRYDLLTRPGKLEAPLIEHNSPRCQTLNCSHVVAYEQHFTSPPGHLTYFFPTLLLELSIADC